MRAASIAFVGILLILACGSSEPGGAALLPEVATFLEEHPEFGAAVATEDVSDWAEGRRQRVRFESGRNLLFYMRDGVVITVYEGKREGRVKVWGDYSN